MSAWPGKTVIGLTGNIATGKSVVRKMLEHLGAYGIDADALAHRTIAQGAPGYQTVLDTFGRWVLGSDGQIDRAKLGKLVFADAEAMSRLEGIIHPLVLQAVDILVRRAPQKVVVIEAIKLIESGLHARCDSLWVTYTPEAVQLARLMQKRGMDEAMARQRIVAQSPQDEKLKPANFVIRNDGSFESAWLQVNAAWQKMFPQVEPEPQPVKPLKGEMFVQRARPQQADEIAALISRFSNGRHKPRREEIMVAFGEKAFLMLMLDDRPAGLLGWKVENLVARTDDLYLAPELPVAEALKVMLAEVERASKELQCEVLLLFIPAEFSSQEIALRALGYQLRSLQSLGVRAWQEAAIESMPRNTMMFFRQLRQDRVLRPV